MLYIIISNIFCVIEVLYDTVTEQCYIAVLYC